MPTYIHLPQTPSTNNYARELIQQNLAQPTTVITAAHQTQGKGQFGKTWTTEPNKNVTLSILFLMNETQLLQPFVLLAKCALAVRQALQDELQEAVFIKWMNDIYCNDKKAAGILIETVNHQTNPNLKWIIVGVGVNVNQTNFGELANKATSLQLLTNKNYNLDNFTQSLVTHILNFWEQHNMHEIIKNYNTHLFKKDKTARLKKNNIAFEAIIKSVDANGKLYVQNAIWESFEFGEVVWMG